MGRLSMNNLLTTLGIIIAVEKANGACNEPSGKIEYEQFAQVLQRNEAMRL